MRRKSERNKSKSSVEKKPVEPSPRKSRRTSRRRKRSTSHSSSDDSDDVPLKTTVAVVEKHETVVCTPVDEPKKSTSHSASDEDKQEQPIWKVKTSEAPSGEIQKLKICLQRPPTTPERTEKSPRRRRGKASSQSDDASLTPDEKTPVSGAGRRRLRRDSPAITPPVTAADAAIAKDECMIVVTEPSVGKGKFECSQTTAGRTEGSRTTVLPSAGDESLKQCEIKQDDSIATTRVDAQPPQQEQTVQLQPTAAADSNDTDKIDVTSVASVPEQKEAVAVAVEQAEKEEDSSSRLVKDTSASSSTLDSSKVEAKTVDCLQQSTEVSSLNARDIIKQQSKDEATSEQITEATSEKITKAAVEEINKPAVKDISEEAAQKITKAVSEKITGPVLKEITETVVKEISEEALKTTTGAVVKESPEVCSKQATNSPTAASEPASQQTSKASVQKRSEVVKETSDVVISEATKETPEVCSKQSAISLATSEVAAQETSTATSQETNAVTSHQISDPAVKQSSEEVGKKTSEAVVKQTSEVCSQQSAISLTASELSLEETNATASQEISEATQPIKVAASQETSEATSQQTKKIASQETKEAASQETIEATRQATKDVVVQKTKDVAVAETEEAVVQKTKAAAVQETKETTRQETSQAASQETKQASKQETKEASKPETKEAVVQETNEAASQKTKKAASQETKETTTQATNETSVSESSEATAHETNVAVSDQPTVTPSDTSEVSSQKTNDTVSSDVTSHDSEVVCTQSTEVTAETKVASPDTTEASNNEVSSSDGSAKDNVQTTADTSKVTSISGEKCTVVPKETSEAECTRVESNSELVSEPEMPQTSEHKPTKQESNIVQKDSIKVSEAHSESAETKTVTEVPDKSDSKDRIGSPKPEKTNLVEGEKMVDSSKQSSETLTKKESSDSETIPVKTANITADLTSIVRTEVLANRKRKWGKYQALLLPDEHITMEKISKLYPGMKILSEDELRMDAEDTVREKPPRKEREVTVTAPIPPPLAVKDEDVEKDVSNIGLNRKISIVNDEASKLQPPPSPSKNAVSAVLYITNLVRPFTLKQLKELLSRTGTILDDGFWTDRIKSKCYVQYENADEAEATRNALHGVQWPIGNGKKLMIDFGTQEAMEAARSATTEAPAPTVVAKPAVEKLIEKVPPTHIAKKEPQVEESRWEKTKTAPVREWDVGKVPQDQHDRSRSRDRPVSRNDRSEKRRHSRNESPPNGDHVTARKKKKDEPTEVKLMDDLFHKTKATPSIYWLPLTPEQIAKKQQQRLQRMAEHKRRMEESRRGERDFGRGGARARRRSARHDAD